MFRNVKGRKLFTEKGMLKRDFILRGTIRIRKRRKNY